jgi:hypothetical protein
MDSSGDGKTGADEFAQHFDQVLSSGAAEFDATITQFMAAAAECSAAVKTTVVGSVGRGRDSNAARTLSLSPSLSPRMSGLLSRGELRQRQAALRGVFGELDLDITGGIHIAQLRLLEDAQQSLDTPTTWTKQENDKLILQLGAEVGGMVKEGAFVKQFVKSLQELPDWNVDLTIKQLKATTKSKAVANAGKVKSTSKASGSARLPSAM